MNITEMERPMIREREVHVVPGGPVAVLLPAIGLGLLALVVANVRHASVAIPCVVAILLVIFAMVGLFIVQPNQGKVLQLFGRYVGTVREPGLKWASPFYTKRKVSLRIRNFETAKLKVNDHDGSPIDIATVVVWRVVDTAEAAFEVDDYEHFVRVQSESALRNLATHHTYDAHEDDRMSLRGNTAEVADQ